MIYHIPKGDFSATGKVTRTWGIEVYQLPVPSIISPDTAQKVADRFACWKAYPAVNLRDKILAAGLAYCKTCNPRLIVISGHRDYIEYSCVTRNNVGSSPVGCVSTIRHERRDVEIWDKVWRLFSDPVEFEQKIQARIAELQTQAKAVEVDSAKLERQLDDLAMQRQRVITQARTKKISESDMDTQLVTPKWQEANIRYELAQAQLLPTDRRA